MYSTVEYTYDNDRRHLSDDDAIEAYKSAKLSHPDAIVILEDLNCHHWDVRVYENEKQKELYYHKRLNSVYRQLLSKFKAWAK